MGKIAMNLKKTMEVTIKFYMRFSLGNGIMLDFYFPFYTFCIFYKMTFSLSSLRQVGRHISKMKL